MEPWQAWLEMAREAASVARLAEDEQCWRSATSRYYYAAYQAVTAVLIYSKLNPPVGEEAWSQAATPELLKEHFTPYIRNRDERKELARQLGELYKIRIEADYRGGGDLSAKVKIARRYSGRIRNMVEEALPQE